LKPSGGEYRIPIARGGAVADCQIGLVFRRRCCCSGATVLQNTMLPPTRSSSTADAMRKARHAVARHGRAEGIRILLSVRTERRHAAAACSITRALLHDPPILLMTSRSARSTP